jgi:hypothetical protein
MLGLTAFSPIAGIIMNTDEDGQIKETDYKWMLFMFTMLTAAAIIVSIIILFIDSKGGKKLD